MNSIKYNSNKFFHFTLSLLAFALLSSCSTDELPEKTTTEEHGSHAESSMVELTTAQYKMADIELVNIEKRSLSNVVKVSGVMDTPPQQLVSISAPMGGFLKSTDLLQGMKVKKGQVLAILEHPEYVQLQQDYLDKKNKLEFLQFEFTRQEKLNRENVNSQKVFQQAKTDLLSMQIQVKGLEEKLAIIGIDSDKLSQENLSRKIKIYSPISGYVSEVNTNIGKYVNPTDVLFEIVDTEHLHAELTVFEKDIEKLRIGQKVRFKLPNSSKEMLASIYLIGRKINADRSVRVHAHLEKEDESLLPGMYINALIEVTENEVQALPEISLVQSEGRDYIFTLQASDTSSGENHIEFEMVEVNRGVTEGGFTEVSLVNGEISALGKAKVVAKGTYALLSKMKNTEEEGGGHGH